MPSRSPPEVASGAPYEAASEMFSYGVLVFEINFAQLPNSPVPSIPEEAGEHLRKLLQELWRPNPQDRPGCRTALEAEYFQQNLAYQTCAVFGTKFRLGVTCANKHFVSKEALEMNVKVTFLGKSLTERAKTEGQVPCPVCTEGVHFYTLKDLGILESETLAAYQRNLTEVKEAKLVKEMQQQHARELKKQKQELLELDEVSYVP